MKRHWHLPVVKGFTLSELVIVIGISLILLSIATVNLFQTQHNSSLQSRLETVVTELRSQQTRAMAGEVATETSAVPYGIYFSATSYTLYKGDTYNPSDASNTVIQLEPSLQFSAITFPSSIVLFEPISGEVVGYSSSQDTVTLQDTVTGETKTITVNPYGVPSEVN